MLRRLSKELAGLVVDCRSSAKVTFRSSFKKRSDQGWLQLQMELLRETLESNAFSAAMQRILSFPHEQLTSDLQKVRTDRPIRWTSSAIRQLAHGQPRRGVPENHALRKQTGMASIAESVFVPRRIRNLDTAENRFIKFALEDVRSFLSHAEGVFLKENAWKASAALAKRLSLVIEDWLGRSMFREIGAMRYAPLGSPVLQRKSGYREILHWWLRFHSASELSWKAGEDLFKSGQRNIAELYEYWLFFELLQWFCKTCNHGGKPPIESLVDGLDGGRPQFKLKKNYELGPFLGSFAGTSRKLNIRFSYNRIFKFTKQRRESGSWTRNMHPDYTLSFWPEGSTEEGAEQNETLVHVHFDAKYRVGNLEALFGNLEEDECDKVVDHKGNYKHQDLLKMHAYRDAIKRSQGAYVLYPGNPHKDRAPMQGFHEILPGLGAFAIAPGAEGEALGLGELEEFLKKVLRHLGNRTSAMERVNYHVANANKLDGGVLRENSVEYGDVILPEKDQFDPSVPALPPAEHKVLVVWSKDDSELGVWNRQNMAFVRLGDRPGSLEVSSELFGVRHLLVRRSEKVFGGLRRFTKDGFTIFSGKDLNNRYKLKKEESNIYAVFQVEADLDFENVQWDEERIWQKIAAKRQRSNPKAKPLSKRRSPDPVVLSLRELVKA